MKTLINQNNPQIRITAPEIEKITTLGYTNYEIAREGMFPLLFNPKEWTLVEEEPEKTREIRACIGYALACIPNEKIKDFGVSLKDCLDYVAPVDKGLREEPVDLEKFIEKAQRVLYSSNPDDYIKLVKELAELGRKGGSK